MADIDKVENWRLSRIEDELEKLDFTQDFLDHSFSDSIFNSLSSEIGQSLKLTAAKTETSDQKVDEGYSEEDEEQEFPPPPPSEDHEEFPPPPEHLLYPADVEEEEDAGTRSELIDPGPELNQLARVCVQDEPEGLGIYSETNVKPVIKKRVGEEDAVKKITDKYDSLKKLTLPSLPKFIPPGYVKAKPTSVVTTATSAISVSSPIVTLQHAPQIPPPATTTTTHTTTKMTDPFLECLPALPSQAPPPPLSPKGMTWSDMDAPGAQRAALGERQQRKGPNHSSIIKRTSFVSSLTENEILQVEMFYRSHKSDVFVCSCVADLLYGSAREGSSNNNANGYADDGDIASGWTHVMTAVPVIILESEDRHGNKKLSLVMAEKGTGFCLWRETFTHLTDYTAKQPHFHTMHLGADHTKLAGISFQETSGGSDFLLRLRTILTNPDISIVNINARSKKTKKSKNGSKLKRRPTSKGDISAPCCFTHITSLDRSEGMGVLEMTGNNEEDSATNVSIVHSRPKPK